MLACPVAVCRLAFCSSFVNVRRLPHELFRKKRTSKKKKRKEETKTEREFLSPSRANKNYPTTVGYIFAHVNRPLKPSINPFFLSFNLRFFSLSLSFFIEPYRAKNRIDSNGFHRVTDLFSTLKKKEKDTFLIKT